MRRVRLDMPLVQVFLIISLLVIGALILLPALSRSREASRRASCQNNLKQLGLVLKMFSNESRGERFPPLSPIPNNWMMDMNAVYPEYLTDLIVLTCPSSPFQYDGIFASRDGMQQPDCVSSLFYVYTGWPVVSDEEAVALYNHYYIDPQSVIDGGSLDLIVPVWEDSDRGQGVGGQSGIPVMWDRVPLREDEFAHAPLGCNVLHMDGHVEFIRYSYYNNSNFFPVTRLSAETFGSALPRLSPDCYSLW